MKIKGFGHNLVKGVKDNASTILTCVSLIGLVGTVIFTAKAAPKVKDRLDEREEDLRDLYVRSKDMTEEEFKKEEKEIKKDAMKDIVKECSKPGACAVVCAFGTIAAQITNLSSIATLSGAVAFWKNKNYVLEEKAKEIIGDGKLTKIKDEIAKDNVNESLSNDNRVPIVDTGNGDELFYDELGNQWFLDKIENVEHQVNKFNADLLNTHASYYDFDSAEQYEEDARLFYDKYLNIPVPSEAMYNIYDRSNLLKVQFTHMDNVLVNGEKRRVHSMRLVGGVKTSRAYSSKGNVIKNHNHENVAEEI